MNTRFALILFVTACMVLASGCAQSKKEYVVTIKTSYGNMVAILYDETPKHKENFIKLAKEKFYDSLLFHRVISGFMIQGGDPDSKKAAAGQPLGRGGPGYTVDAEINSQFFHEKGAFSAARLSDQANPSRASSGSQFYIVQGSVIPKESIHNLKIDQAKFNSAFRLWLSNPANKPTIDSLNTIYMNGDMAGYQKRLIELVPRLEKETGMIVTKELSQEKIDAYTTVGGVPHLDGDYTVFGKVINGLEVIDKIAAVAKDGSDRPLEDVRMTVTVEEMSRKKIAATYGYQYPAGK